MAGSETPARHTSLFRGFRHDFDVMMEQKLFSVSPTEEVVAFVLLNGTKNIVWPEGNYISVCANATRESQTLEEPIVTERSSP